MKKNKSKDKPKDVYWATGRRKTAVARVRIFSGSGKININGESSEKYFPRETLQRIIKQPLEVTSLTEKYDIMANVEGGGKSGQAGAVRHGIARGLVKIDSTMRQPLREAGFITRDSRMKERKKYGQKGARKKFQYSKR